MGAKGISTHHMLWAGAAPLEYLRSALLAIALQVIREFAGVRFGFLENL